MKLGPCNGIFNLKNRPITVHTSLQTSKVEVGGGEREGRDLRTSWTKVALCLCSNISVK